MPADEQFHHIISLALHQRVYITDDDNRRPGIVTVQILIQMIHELSPLNLTHFFGPSGTYFPLLNTSFPICYVAIPEEQNKRLIQWMNNQFISLATSTHKRVVFGVSKGEDDPLSSIRNYTRISIGSV